MKRTAAPVRVVKAAIGAGFSPPPALSRVEVRRLPAPPLRIMHVFDRLDVGGTEKIIMKLVQGFEGSPFQHSLCTLRGVEPAAKSWASGVEVLNAGTEGTNFQFNILRLARLMKRTRPTIVHSRNWGGIEAVLAARIARVPVIIHSEHGYQLEMLHGLPLRQRTFRHLAYRTATAVFTVSQELRSYHSAQAWCKPEKIRVLYNGVDGEKFKPHPEVRSTMRRDLGIPADGLVVGSVGRMVPLKDAMTLLRAAETLLTGLPNIYVLLVGAGPELARLREYVSHSKLLNGHIMLPGSSDHVADLLNAMDVFVLPSLSEGMSNTLLEAMATGLPVVATRVGGNPEVVDESVCGYLFQPRDVGSLSMRLRTLAQDHQLRVQFGKAARQRALKHFSLHGMLRRYYELYVGLAQQQEAAAAKVYVRN
jgi:sugar transferase (PEP-CTERM/EpsH1 system associated)